MVRRLVVVVLLVAYGSHLLASEPLLDSLKRTVVDMPEDSVKCSTLQTISLLQYTGAEAIDYAHQALRLAKKLDNERLIAKSFNCLAWCYDYDEMDKKTAFLDSAANIFHKLDDSEGLGAVYNTRASILLEYGSLEEAIESFKGAYDYFVASGNTRQQAVVLNNWAVTLLDLQKPLEAMAKYETALSFWLNEEELIDIEVGRIYFGMGRCAHMLDQPSLAMDHFIKSYQYRKKAKSYAVAEVLIEMAETIFVQAQQQNDTTELILKINAFGFSNSSALLDSAAAIPSISDRQQFKYTILDAKRKRAVLYKNFDAAYSILLEQKRIDEESKLSEASLGAFANIKSQYEQERLKLQLLEEELENQQKENQLKYLLVFLGIMLLISIIGILVYQNRLKEQHLELTQSKQKQQFIAMQSMLQGQEAERARIARDLHDGLGNLLSTIKVTVSGMSMKGNEKNTESAFSSANELIDEACKEVRKISHEMMPQALERLGLNKALEDMVHTADHTHNFLASFNVFGAEQDLNDNTNLMLFRIVQELLNNIIKYADAQEVLVQLTYGNGWLNLTVEDDGIGFNIDNAQSKGGIGLKSIAFRTEHIGGQFEIESRLGYGTLVSINLPINDKNKAINHD